jgi:hypothetical protein
LSDDDAPISLAVRLYAGWCLLVFILFVISAWFAWGTDTVYSSRSSGVFVSGPNHK